MHVYPGKISLAKTQRSIAYIDTRPLDEKDLEAVLAVQQACYRPALVESRDAFARRFTLFPDGCLGSFDGRELVGYALSHPWRRDEIVQIDTTIDDLPPDPDCLYLHDIAVAPGRRRENIARGLLLKCLNLARSSGLPCLAGVSVQGSEATWRRLGFVAKQHVDYVPSERGTYMVLEISGW